jgi:ribonuclease BN (tRNA processing enzyme)
MAQCSGRILLKPHVSRLVVCDPRKAALLRKYHTTTAQLAALATDAKPKLLVVYHTVAFRPGIAPPKFLSSITSTGASRSTEEILQQEIGSRYSGQFVIGHDLDVY